MRARFPALFSAEWLSSLLATLAVPCLSSMEVRCRLSSSALSHIVPRRMGPSGSSFPLPIIVIVVSFSLSLLI
ncbi:hypothetical protein B0T26DRAFT_345046 [Lasiosphaeria miniovina]|uniref:Secreted protein n=1 Tax=Lasiosphaeria miniovina TaxID=1954250 RepID=A0AA40DRE4_9PEZI|nr:uncharacterized protein B0T26DRAFT_345046 [Lasiosphaeria miniovina]KAK0712775.1 hypothetical protein B0T26DRAFT_345046 [Lasiosphaeria miniovina]